MIIEERLFDSRVFDSFLVNAKQLNKKPYYPEKSINAIRLEVWQHFIDSSVKNLVFLFQDY